MQGTRGTAAITPCGAESLKPVELAASDRRWRLLLLGLGVAAADQCAKFFALRALSNGPLRLLGSFVQLRLTWNAGGAFSLFAGATPALTVFAIAAALGVFVAGARASDGWMVTALGLVLGGAMGNLTDRIVRPPGPLRGHVVDYIDIGRWPVFNLADAAITVGVVILIVRMSRRP